MSSNIFFPRRGLEQLKLIFGFCPGSPLWDVVFVSFDLEARQYSPRYNKLGEIVEIGVSMLDTRCFTLDNPAGSLVTRHFVVGGYKRLVHKSKEFHFGTSEHLDKKDINDVILKLLHIPDGIEGLLQHRYRKIVLIGHGLRGDLLNLRRRGIMFEEVRTIVAKFDTTYIARDVLGLNFRLGSLLKMLNCPNENLHNAGNDANFALRAPLLLVYYGLRPSASSPDAIRSLTYFKALGLEPLPDTTWRNAMLRALRRRSEDFTSQALDMGGIIFFDNT